MPIFRSNLIRTTFKDLQLHKYHITCPEPPQQSHELENALLVRDPLCITDGHSIVYLPHPWPADKPLDFSFMTLSGQQSQVTLSSLPIENPAAQKTKFLKLFLNRLMRSTNLLYCRFYDCVLNGFQQRKVSDDQTETPGFTLQSYQEGESTGLFVKGVALVVNKASSMLDDSQHFMDVSTGRFYSKTEAIHYDVEKDPNTGNSSISEVRFANGFVVKFKHLKSISLRQQIGYDLCMHMKRGLERINLASASLMDKWGFSINSKPIDMPVNFSDPGTFMMGNTQKSLNDIIFPVTREAYNHYFLGSFNVPFDKFVECELIVCSGERSEESIILKHNIEKVVAKMSLPVRVTYNCVEGITIQKWQEYLNSLQQQSPEKPSLYIILLGKETKQTVESIKDLLVPLGVLFEFVRTSELSRNQNSPLNQVTATQHLAIIATKFRQAPWILMRSPYGDMPTSVISLNVEQKKNGLYSIAVVQSLNRYLSKFTCAVGEVANLADAPSYSAMMMISILEKFKELHSIYPVRLILFITGKHLPAAQEMYTVANQKIINHYKEVGNSKLHQLVVVKARDSVDLRLFFQSESGYIGRENVKPVGLLACLILNSKLYIQLEYYAPITEFDVFHEDKDPQITRKISELIVRLAFGSVGNRFGGGQGFLGFARKLNHYRDRDIGVHWKKYLADGNMVFL